MKKALKVLTVVLSLSLAMGAFVGCGGGKSDNGDSVPVGVESEEKESVGGESLEPETSVPETSEGEEESFPTAKTVLKARKNAVEATKQNYDFHFNLTGEVALLGYDKAIEADYQAEYRYDTSTNALKFKRVTSGELLYDSTEYVYSAGDQRIKVIMNKDGEVKKQQVMLSNEEGLTLINKPLTAIVNHLEEKNVIDIEESSVSGYEYEARLVLAFDNPYLAAVYDLLGCLGTEVSIKDVTLNNPANGLAFYFNLENNELVDFKFEASISFPVAMADVTLALTYEQKKSTKDITIPTTDGLIVESNAIQKEVNAISSAITSVKNSEDYSLDIFARNEFDPAWNKLATVDSYTGRLYKNTDGDNVWFNHSYKYKAHHEEDGAEAYEYALGNLKDGTVYLASYKGDNTYTVVDDVTVDSQFDYMVAPILQNVTNIDCIKKVEKDDVTTYTLYIGKSATLAMQDTIIDLINSNEAEGVVDVNNYMNAEYMIKEAEIVVTMENGVLTEIKALTELKYAPTGGEFTDYNITLTNTLEFLINDKLSKAEKYEAPGKADGWVDNLESIL